MKVSETVYSHAFSWCLVFGGTGTAENSAVYASSVRESEPCNVCHSRQHTCLTQLQFFLFQSILHDRPLHQSPPLPWSAWPSHTSILHAIRQQTAKTSFIGTCKHVTMHSFPWHRPLLTINFLWLKFGPQKWAHTLWSVVEVAVIFALQSDIGFGKLQTYTKLEKLGEVSGSNCKQYVAFAGITSPRTPFACWHWSSHFSFTQEDIHVMYHPTSLTHCWAISLVTSLIHMIPKVIHSPGVDSQGKPSLFVCWLGLGEVEVLGPFW